jgi:hypothetical protein
MDTIMDKSLFKLLAINKYKVIFIKFIYSNKF